MTAVDCSTIFHVCQKCGQEKPLIKEFWFVSTRRNKKTWMKHACKNCVNDARRESEKLKARERRSSEDGRLKYNQLVRNWKRSNPEKIKNQRRNFAEKNGREYKEKKPYNIERAYDRVIERNARDAFDWWFAKKSDEEVVMWYEASGEPWKNPRLTPGQAWSARYRVDPQFREHEKARLYLKKIKRKRKVIAESDGTVPFDLLEKAKSCLYCGIKFNDQCKPTLDHLIPLSKGGTHSAANAVVCCLSCNSSKGNRDFLKFVEKLIEPFKTQAINAWRKLRGASPQQQALI
jgi:5-methylcytosine-specific restriction endonuclease McrA